MRKTILLLASCIYALMLTAIPAKRQRYTLKLADGSSIEATAMGDEMLHYFQTDDGRCLQCDSLGIAHFVAKEVLQARRQAKAERRLAAKASKKKARNKEAGAPSQMIGTKRGLVILVQFPDVKFQYTIKNFRDLFNKNGYTDDINVGSVRDYFLDASYGQFDFSFNVIGPVTVSRNLSYYGANNSNGDDKYPATMVAEAIQLVDEKVDFSQFDWDGDGIVEQIFVIHSGYDEAQSNTRNDIWSHAWTLTEAKDEGDGNGPVTADGVVIDSYATCSELRDRTGINIVGIGTACHEFSHCFGLPDFYDTQGSNFGMDSWDILDYGSYNGNGGRPTAYTSYERMFCGWLQPIELSEPVKVLDMPALTSEPVAYILRNPGKKDEYFLLENRQKDSWDKLIGGHGMLILHVDYDETAWVKNTVNTVRSHQRMTIVPADNSLYRYSLAGDPWPGTSGKTEFSDTSSPAGKFFNNNTEGNKMMSHSFTEITESADGHISFIFDEEALGIPTIIPKERDNYVYDLAGRRIINVQKPGVYIKNGKKIKIQ